MRRVRVRLGNNRVEQHQRMANCASTDGSGRTDRAGWLQTGRARGSRVFLRARGRVFDECLPCFCHAAFSSQAAKAGIAIVASPETEKVW